MPHNGPDQLARVLGVLASGTRVRIVQLLQGRALCVNALGARLKVTQAAVSQHRRIMRDAGLVIAEKRGYFVHYRLNEQTLAAWQEDVEKLLVPTVRAGTETKRVRKRASETEQRKAPRRRKTERTGPTGKRMRRVDQP